MTTLVRTRQPLLVLDMSNQPERRKSKRLAGMFGPSVHHRSRVAEAGTTDNWNVATSVYDEQDGDFLFTRASKKVKTAPEPEPEAVVESPTTAPPAKKGVGRPPKSVSGRGSTRKVASPSPPPAAQPKPAPAQPKRTSKRKSSLATAVPVAAREEDELAVSKTRGRRKARESAEKKIEEEEEPQEEAPPPRRSTKSTRANGTRAAKARVEPQEEDDSLDLVAGTPVDRRGANSESQQIALPFSDTPIINRNKELRKKGGASGSRRSSLGMRGRRASSLIDNGHSALPHREVDPSEFYKHISAEGLSEPRRMKQLLIWCGERALSEKPPHGSHGSSAVLGARAIQDQLLKDFGQRSEFSDWFSREEEPQRPVVLKPNPRNIEHDAKIEELEARINRLKEEKRAWQALAKPLPEVEPLYPDDDPRKAPLPDESLLDPEEAKILASLTNPEWSFNAFKRQTRSRLQNLQADLEFKVDHLADSVHKLDQRVVTAGREADQVLAVSAVRLKGRDEREKAAVGTRELPTMEVLRSLGRILPEGTG
ncbi:Mis12-Mtw1 protein family-domain-containing protein [Podospora aff. communis PSN243]|uniref:Mis12-Mtw1 protein family-domain-containing protein n=1 Tax=Podospora aff. communis PSN243 TaxID=3040156 RepID=A0AAV9GYW6_9PEZI|nr:Mis12-Mtw1 protein family-domain-containing protein [Podospora aff. communis PSN243]